MYMAKSAKKPVQTCFFYLLQLCICTLCGYNVYFLVVLFPAFYRQVIVLNTLLWIG